MSKKITTIIIILILIIVSALIPIPKSGVNLWLYFTGEDIEVQDANGFAAYYATKTSPSYSGDKVVEGIYDFKNRRVEFTFQADCVEDINSIRIDFPAVSQTVTVGQVSISSGGAIKKQVDPAKFLNEGNIIFTNDIDGYNAIESKCITVFATGSEDPYIVLADQATDYIVKQQSRHIATRIGIFSY